jgi:hypothetical protein
MLVALASAVFFGSESLGTHDHLLLSEIWDFPFRRLLRLAGSRWRYSTPPPHGFIKDRISDKYYIKFSSYLTGNSSRLRPKAQQEHAVQEEKKNQCLSWESYGTHKHVWLRLAVATTNDFMINQYFIDWNLFPATCFSPQGTIIRQKYMNRCLGSLNC